MYGDKISSDKAKINVIKNVKKEKVVFYDVMIWFDKWTILLNIKDGYVESSVDYNNKVESIDHRVIIFVHAFIIALHCFVYILCMWWSFFVHTSNKLCIFVN